MPPNNQSVPQPTTANHRQPPNFGVHIMDPLHTALAAAHHQFHPVLPWAPGQRLLPLDLSEANPDFSPDIFTHPSAFDAYISGLLAVNRAQYGIGGYAELRAMYQISEVFGQAGPAGLTTVLEEQVYPGIPQALAEPRRLHLGVDLWAPAGTPVVAPLGGMVHSFGFRPQLGDYGGVIILMHQLEGQAFHSLYGHLSQASLSGMREGRYVNRGETFATLGSREENGQWPPHLHLQLIRDMEMFEGDYPGVCRWSERSKYLHNCPDAHLILHWPL